MPPSRSNSNVNGPPSAGMPPQQQQGGAPPGQGQQSQQNLNQIVRKLFGAFYCLLAFFSLPLPTMDFYTMGDRKFYVDLIRRVRQ